MNITQEQVGENHLKVIMNVEPQDYLGKVDEEIKSLGKKVSMDGFRPGKVPLTLTRKMYGDSVLADQLQKIISDSLSGYIKENELKVFGEPLQVAMQQNRISIQRPEAYTFGFELGIMPSFELPLLDEKVFPKKILTITDEMVKEEVERLRSRHGEREYPEAAADEDILSGSFQELNEDGTPMNEGIQSTSSFSLKVIKDEDAKQQLMGLKKEETCNINIRAAFGNDDEMIIHHILRTDHHKAEHMSARFSFTLKNIVRVIKSELSQEFYDKAFGAGNVSSEEQMNEKIREAMVQEFSKYTNQKLDGAIQDYFFAETKIDLPLTFLRRLLDTNREEGKPEMTDEEFNEAVRQVKWDLTFERLATANNIEATDEEIRGEAIRDIMNYVGGDTSFYRDNPEMFNNTLQSILSEKKNVTVFRARVMNEKLFASLRSAVKTEEQLQNEHEFFHH